MGFERLNALLCFANIFFSGMVVVMDPVVAVSSSYKESMLPMISNQFVTMKLSNPVKIVDTDHAGFHVSG
jgi:hypothetical protein